MLDTHVPGPVNLGNPVELHVADLAQLVLRLTGSSVSIMYRPLPEDDPTRRRPDVAKAKESSRLGAGRDGPDGLKRTMGWFRGQGFGLRPHGAAPTSPGLKRPFLFAAAISRVGKDLWASLSK